MLNIRKTNNLDLIARLDRRIFGESAEDEGIDPSTVWWVLEWNGKVAGFCGLKPFIEDGRCFGLLTKAGILKDARGFGLQRNLIDVRDKEAKKLGLLANITYVADWNLASANNLIKCGYELYSPESRWGLKNALYFWKDLGMPRPVVVPSKPASEG